MSLWRATHPHQKTSVSHNKVFEGLITNQNYGLFRPTNCSQKIYSNEHLFPCDVYDCLLFKNKMCHIKWEAGYFSNFIKEINILLKIIGIGG